MPGPVSVEELLARRAMDESPELRLLFHRLNNQLDHPRPRRAPRSQGNHRRDVRSRAAQVVASASSHGTAQESASSTENPTVLGQFVVLPSKR